MSDKKVRKEDGLDLLMRALGTNDGGRAIMDQESAGQQSFVSSDTLPTDLRGKEVLEAEGVKFLGPVEGDDIFQYVELPEGWKKVPTDHSMWSNLVDGAGRIWASIFYKAAFYDRSAHASARKPEDE
ncbi:MAG: hypothetical protein Q8Q30_00550 [Candidatus Woesebacteria bacterium]|nr:hypothetical protein [Candidatus Woesebacteria bacterium]